MFSVNVCVTIQRDIHESESSSLCLTRTHLFSVLVGLSLFISLSLFSKVCHCRIRQRRPPHATGDLHVRRGVQEPRGDIRCGTRRKDRSLRPGPPTRRGERGGREAGVRGRRAVLRGPVHSQPLLHSALDAQRAFYSLATSGAEGCAKAWSVWAAAAVSGALVDALLAAVFFAAEIEVGGGGSRSRSSGVGRAESANAALQGFQVSRA